jgi:exonuclease III
LFLVKKELMRLVTWNCRIGGFRKKAKHVAPLRPDVLAVQEVEPIDDAAFFAGECQPTFRDRLGDPAFPRRAIGVFSYTDTKLQAVDVSEPMYSFRRYEAHHGGLSFNVVAVWPWQTRSSKTAYRQAHEGLSRYAAWIRERPTVILGDFNANASFKGNNWRELLDLLQPLGLASAYHRYFGEQPGKEEKPTHFHKGKQTSSFHLDYCFLPEVWVQHIKKVDVGAYTDWHTVSDHAPLVVDLDL